MADTDRAATARRLVASCDRAYIGTPLQWYVVQLRSEAAGWPDWIDVSESMRRPRAEEQLREIEAAAAQCPELELEVRIVDRLVLA